MPRKKQLTGRYRHRKHWWGWKIEVEEFIPIHTDHLPSITVISITDLHVFSDQGVDTSFTMWSKATVQDLLDLGFINVR